MTINWTPEQQAAIDLSSNAKTKEEIAIAYEAIRKAFGYDATQTATAIGEIELRGETTCKEYKDLERAEFALEVLLKAGMDAELLQI